MYSSKTKSDMATSFQYHFREFTTANLGTIALRNQKECLKKAQNPDKHVIKAVDQQVNENTESFSKEDLISEVISRSIHNAWVKHYVLAKLHLQTEIKDISTNLIGIEAQVRVRFKKKTRPR
jgi:hypothetical protein